MHFIFHIYQVAKQVGEVLVKQVKKSTGKDMNLAFVSPANAKVAFNLLSIKICKILMLIFHPQLNFTSSTFSFNLPSPPNATNKVACLQICPNLIIPAKLSDAGE